MRAAADTRQHLAQLCPGKASLPGRRQPRGCILPTQSRKTGGAPGLGQCVTAQRAVFPESHRTAADSAWLRSKTLRLRVASTSPGCPGSSEGSLNLEKAWPWCVWLKGVMLTALLPTAQSRAVLAVAPLSSAAPSPRCLPTDAPNEPGYELAFRGCLWPKRPGDGSCWLPTFDFTLQLLEGRAAPWT